MTLKLHSRIECLLETILFHVFMVNGVTERDERWTFGTSLNVEDPAAGTFRRLTLYSSIALVSGQNNWILASVPTPNVVLGWKVKAIMLRYRISPSNPELGIGGRIDKIGIRDGDKLLHEFDGLNLGPITNWQTLRQELPNPLNFQFGLGVLVHVDFPSNIGATDQTQSTFYFASIGLEFVKGGIAPPRP
jgi:hypothetical protein